MAFFVRDFATFPVAGFVMLFTTFHEAFYVESQNEPPGVSSPVDLN
jgi:hypothetical protein